MSIVRVVYQVVTVEEEVPAKHGVVLCECRERSVAREVAAALEKEKQKGWRIVVVASRINSIN